MASSSHHVLPAAKGWVRRAKRPCLWVLRAVVNLSTKEAHNLFVLGSMGSFVPSPILLFALDSLSLLEFFGMLGN